MKLIKILLFGILAINLTGCAAGLALLGKREPQIADLRRGMSRNDAHFILREYTPNLMYSDGSNKIEEYAIEVGNAPNIGRAACHAIMNVSTLGLWELIATPIERFTPPTMKLIITYSDDKIVEINKIGRWKYDD